MVVDSRKQGERGEFAGTARAMPSRYFRGSEGSGEVIWGELNEQKFLSISVMEMK